ncbi:PE-PPE domain-containing protein [Rhodococcus sp. NPDC003383]
MKGVAMGHPQRSETSVLVKAASTIRRRRTGLVGVPSKPPGHVAIRTTASIGVAVSAVIGVMAVGVAATVSPPVPPVKPAASTALILGTSTVPTPDDYWVETVMNQFIVPTHPGQTITPVAVTTPEEGWPLGGLLRILELVLGPPEIWGLDGPGWPDEPWWKLTGLFDRTLNQSLEAGLDDLERAMAEHGNDHLVIYGYSQSAILANLEKRKLAEQYPAGTPAPDIDFVLGGDFNLPNGGFFARFPGLYIPILDWSFNGPEPADTQFDTVVITRQYDPFADFPLYPLNLIADLNAALGFFYVHSYPFDVSLADPAASSAFQGTHGDTSYYFFPTEDLPLFGPLRTLGVPESAIDVVEPTFRVVVESGYDRSIPPWQPTPARLFPPLDPVKVTADLVEAVGEGVDNALAHFAAPPLPSIPAAAVADASQPMVDQPPSPVRLFPPEPATVAADIVNAVGKGVTNFLAPVGPYPN